MPFTPSGKLVAAGVAAGLVGWAGLSRVRARQRTTEIHYEGVFSAPTGLNEAGESERSRQSAEAARSGNGHAALPPAPARVTLVPGAAGPPARAGAPRPDAAELEALLAAD
jgi:hypothetical protein